MDDWVKLHAGTAKLEPFFGLSIQEHDIGMLLLVGDGAYSAI